jgi:diguanylate cyclase (GGDEF)-like protein
MAAVVMLFFFAFQMLFSHLALLDGALTIWWPLNGIALGILLMVRRRHWWWILLAFAAAIVVSERNDTLLELGGAAICNTLEVASTALVLPKFRTMDKWLSQPRVASRFMLMVMLAAPTSAALLSLVYHEPGAPPLVNAVRWAAADALGIILFTPLLLALFSPELWGLFRPAALPRTLALLALLAGSSWLAFHQVRLPIAFVVYPVVLLLGTQLGLSGAAIGIDLLALIATSATLRGLGPFAPPPGTPAFARLLVLQLYLLLAVAMTLPVSVARVRRLTTEAQLRRAWKKMADLASVDGLTGVANRRQFDATLDMEWARARRGRSPLSLLMIDVDHFKRFNDNYGHLAGDACLRKIATAIRSIPCRPADLVARYGGEEFAILLPGSSAAGAHAIADLARHAVSDLAVPHLLSPSERVTISVGLASLVPPRAGEATELIAAADRALYEAKHNGRNRVQIALEEVVASS